MRDVFDLIEEGKVRRFFRAKNKISFEGAISHVTQHAAGAEPLFLEISDYLYMLHLMKEVSKRFKFHILSFVLMLNHLHLLLRLGDANLSIAMKNLFELYANYFNRKYERKGHVFSSQYRSALCFDEYYLLASSLYIHLNPVKANLVRDPLDYRWSSCSLFVTDIEKDTFVDYRFVLSVLNENISKARPEYKALLQKATKVNLGNILEQPKALEQFAQSLRGDDLEDSIERLKNKERLRKPHDKEARVFLIRQLKARGFNMTEIAQRLNLSRQHIYEILK